MLTQKVPDLGTFSMVAGEIFIQYAGEQFPFLFGREGTLDAKGTYLSMFYGDTETEEQSM